jgi:hypothetical protein
MRRTTTPSFAPLQQDGLQLRSQQTNREVTMKRYAMTLVALFAMGLGTQALAEDETQAAASTETTAAVSETPAADADASTDAAAAEPSTAADPMPTTTDSDSK